MLPSTSPREALYAWLPSPFWNLPSFTVESTFSSPWIQTRLGTTEVSQEMDGTDAKININQNEEENDQNIMLALYSLLHRASGNFWW